MNEIVKAILGRRSIRKYSTEQVSEAALEVILRAATYAPSAGGRQSALIVVCQNREVNGELGKVNRAAFRGVRSTENSYVSREQPSIADDAAIESGFYGAPTVLTLFAPKNFPHAMADCSVAAQNIMLAAHSLGIGSCLVARANDTFSCELGQRVLKEWQIAENLQAQLHVTLGYALSQPPQAKPRKENRVKRVS